MHHTKLVRKLLQQQVCWARSMKLALGWIFPLLHAPDACAADIAKAIQSCPAGLHEVLGKVQGLLHGVQDGTPT
jgi:hypothetical protein